MIDTLILRIHNTEKYHNLIKNLDVLDNHGSTAQSMRVKTSEIRKVRRLGFKTGQQIIDVLKLNHSGDYLIRTKSAKHRNASNHYELSYFINYIKDFIEFNFSIPKYNFGSNILMFVDHIGDKEYNYHQCCEADHNINRSYDLLMKFLSNFFKMEFPGNNIDYNDVEVHRIDVCFNQVFKTKQDALKYLEYQKRQRKKYSRDEEGVTRDYATSLMYVSKRYSAKIYHKGSEYEKNDLKEHLKYNKEKKRTYFKTGEYQKLADRILRYELTIRNGMLNYLHKSNLFRQNCPYYKKHYDIYMQVENATQKNDRISKKVGSLTGYLKEAYQLEHPYEKILSDSRKIHKYVSKMITRRTYFKLEIDENAKLYNSHSSNIQSDDALFSRNLLLLCLYKMVEFIYEYQIKELPPEKKIEDLITSYNLRHKNKLPKSDMCAFYRELTRLGSFKDIAKFEFYSRATMYRYKDRFKKIGITEHNLIPLTENGIPGSELDLRSYHWEMTANAHFLNKKNFIGLW